MKKFSFLLIFVIFFSSCTLKYEEENQISSEAPELIFTKPVFTRFDNGKTVAQIQASELERYKTSSMVYASGVEFKSYNINGELSAEGNCGLLSADQKNGSYMLFDGIKLFSKEYEASFFANFLKWNEKNEQLIGSMRDTVRIEKDDMIVFGTGFSASKVSGTYKFFGTITGETEAKSE